MEEVDNIIFHFLRQLNVSIDKNIKSLCDLSTETIINSTLQFLLAINKDIKISTDLPASMWQRIEIATNLATLCKDLGYANDIGYQTFLYSNESELRQLFMFLIEKIPNDSKENNANDCGKTSTVKQKISRIIKEELDSPWIPPCCNSGASEKDNDSVQYVVQDENFDYNLMKNFIDKINKTEANVKVDPAKETEVPTNKKYNMSLKEMKGTAMNLQNEIETMENEKKTMIGKISQMQKKCDNRKAELDNLNNILESFGIADVTNHCDVIGIINKKIENLHKTSEDLISKNLTLKAELDHLISKNQLLESEKSKAIRILHDLKETAKKMKFEYEKKEELKVRLRNSFEKFKNENKRSVYTKRILEIIGNIEKQNLEINKIIGDNRELQKEINSLDGQLDRSFTLADETLFQNAKRDDQAKKAYKLLALLHSECNTIVSLIQETSNISRDIIDIEDHIKSEKAKNLEDTLLKIQKDLSNMKGLNQ